MSVNIAGGFFQRFVTFLQDHHLSFANCLLVILTLGGEQAFRNAAFECPCIQPNALAYGLSFLIGPAFILLVVGILVNSLTWKLCHGCIHRSPSAKHGFLRSSRNWVIIVGRAVVAPAAWIFVAFLDGNYYVCLMSNAPCIQKSEENKLLIAVSQIISWVFLASIVAVVFIVILCARCTDGLTFHHSNYLALYRATERQILDERMQERASELAKANVDRFLENHKLNKNDWDEVSMAPLQSVECDSSDRDGCDFSYTPLHHWVKQHQPKMSAVSVGPCDIKLNLVSEEIPMIDENNELINDSSL